MKKNKGTIENWQVAYCNGQGEFLPKWRTQKIESTILQLGN